MRKKVAVLIADNDNVLTVLEDIKKGEWTGTEKEIIQALEDIPCYHKIARTNLKQGDSLFKYGQKIGCAVTDIQKGQWIHTHNLDSEMLEGGRLDDR